MNDEFLKWFGFIGSVASLIGLYYAICQIRKTLRAAEAAKEASLQAQKTISRNLLLSDVSACKRNLEEVKSFVRSKRFDVALIRLTDSISQLIQIREILENSKPAHQFEFKERLSQLSIIRKSLEKKLEKSSAKIDVVQINSQLSEISDDLDKIIGEAKIAVEKVDNGQSKI